MSSVLVDFLLARIAEDEEDARGGVIVPRGDDLNSGWNSARVLAECEAKRRMVELHRRAVAHEGLPFAFDYCEFCVQPDNDGNDYPVEGDWPCEHLRLLALPYVDHLDFREEWLAAC